MSDGPVEQTFEGSWYRLVLRAGKPVAWLDDLDGRHWAELRLFASVDAIDGPDETLGWQGPRVEGTDDGSRLTWTFESSRWTARRLVLHARRETIDVHVEVDGEGRIGDVRLLGGRAVLPASGGGLLLSGAWFETMFSSSPTHPLRIVRPATESAVIGVVSGSEPGRGNWFFTPGPLVYAATRETISEGTVIPDGPWLTFGLRSDVAQASFPGFAYDAIDRGFAFRLDHEGHASVHGSWRSPALVIGHADDPYAAIEAHRADLVAAGIVVGGSPAAGPSPTWWREPIFCGWGAQCRLALDAGLGFKGAPSFATQAVYDALLGHLESKGIVPGTVTIDDKWQAAYGTCLPDESKWPDLRDWIAGRRARGQRVLLWWKAWDAEGTPAEWSVRSANGASLGLDPTHPDGREAIRAAVRSMLAPDALDADGLKIDFTARTPSGVAARAHGSAWGIGLLHELMAIVAEEARRVKPEALLVAHSPNPLFGPLFDMVRLNDTLRLDDPEPRVDVVPQMRYRAAVARAALPHHLIDTDDWCAPDLATWRHFLEIKPELGIPALYYATGLDLSGEDFGEEDYALIRRVWRDYRREAGLIER